VNPSLGTIELFGEKLSRRRETKKKGSKFSDCVATKDGKSLFLIPASSRFVVRIDLATGMKSTVGDDLGTKELKYGKAVEAEGKIFVAPRNAEKVLVINLAANTTTHLAGNFAVAISSDLGKWCGAVLAPRPGPTLRRSTVVVFVPLNASRVLIINPVTLELSLAGGDLGPEPNKFGSACVASDGVVFCMPLSFPRVLRITFQPNGKVEHKDDEAGLDEEAPGLLAEIDPKRPKKKGGSMIRSRLSKLVSNDKDRAQDAGSSFDSMIRSKLSKLVSNDKDRAQDAGSNERQPAHKKYDITWPPGLVAEAFGPTMHQKMKFSDAVLAADGFTIIGVPFEVRTVAHVPLLQPPVPPFHICFVFICGHCSESDLCSPLSFY